MQQERFHNVSFVDLSAAAAVAASYGAAAVFCWLPVLGFAAWLVPLLLLIFEKDSGYVHFHAAQAVVTALIILLIRIMAPLAAWIVNTASGPAETLEQQYNLTLASGLILVAESLLLAALTAALLVAMIQSARYRLFELPLICRLANRIVDKKASC